MSIPEPQKPDPQKLARTAIHLLEQKIHDEFGYDIEMGAELEFVVKVKENSNNIVKESDNPLGLPRDTEVKKRYTTQDKRLSYDAAKDSLFPNSPYICYCYKENDVSPPLYKYEAVISHEGTNKKKVSSDYSRAIHTAKIIDATYATIFGSFNSDNTPLSKNYKHATDLRNNIVEQVILDPSIEAHYKEAKYITNGLHINFSLNNAGGNFNHKTLNYVTNNVKEASLKLMYLLDDDKKSKNRYSERDVFSEKTVKADGEKKKSNFSNDSGRIENAVPSAASNPYYAILVTLLGVYSGLKQMEIPTNTDSLVESASKAKDVFEAADNPYRKILNELDSEYNPDLGDHFWNAIAQTPPSQETRLYQKAGRFNLQENGRG